MREWWVNLVADDGPHRTYKIVGVVKASSPWAAMELAVEKYGHLEDGQRLAVDGRDLSRTAWDVLLDDDLGI